MKSFKVTSLKRLQKLYPLSKFKGIELSQYLGVRIGYYYLKQM